MFVRTIGPATAKIFLVGEAPGEYEDLSGKPFSQSGNSGRMLDQLLNQSGLVRQECLIGNVAKERPPGNKIEFFFEDRKCTIPKPIMRKWIEYLKREIETYRPNIVVCLGWLALWALTGERGIQKFRGFIMESTLVPGQKVIATHHPQSVSDNWQLCFPAIMDLRKAVRHSETPNLPVDRRVLSYTPSKKQFIDYCKYLINDHKDPVAYDIENAVPTSHIDIIGLAESPLRGMSIEILRNKEPRFNPDEEMEIWYWVAKVLSSKPGITHNGSHDVACLWYHNHILCHPELRDTQIGFHVIWPEIPRSLGFASSVCLDVPAWKHTQSTEGPAYNCADAVNTYGVWKMVERKLTEHNAWNTYNKEMRQLPLAVMMQLQGIYFNKTIAHELVHGEGGIIPELQRLNGEFERTFGKVINIGSHKQLKTLLYDDLKLPEQYAKRKSINDPRVRTSNAEALSKLKVLTDNPILDDILKWKKLAKRKTFLDIPVSPQSRVHTSYNITGARMQEEKKGFLDESEDDHKSFGRWSSSKSIILPFGSGNLQNIPKPARKAYTAPDGYEFLSADYVQAEAVVVAYEINDVKLINMFRASFGKTRTYRKENNLDIHNHTAGQMFGIDVSTVTADQRTIGKTIRHANNYSAGPSVIASKLGISLKEAKILMTRYHDQCPQLRLWHKKIRTILEHKKVLVNLLGRKHEFTERWGDDLFRSAYSYIPQSTVGDLLNDSLVDLYEKYGSELIIYLQLHDAMYILSKVSDRAINMKKIHSVMMRPLTSSLGEEYMIDVDFSVGKSWGDMEDIDDPYTIMAEAA